MVGLRPFVPAGPQGDIHRDLILRQIDALMYQLYGLTDEEIKIVEGRV